MTIRFTADGRDVHVDVPLSNVAMDYRPQDLIADMIFPVVPVPKQSDRIPVFNRGEAYRVEEARRAPGTEANVIARNVSSLTFFADNYALKTRLTIEQRENADPIYRQKLYNQSAEYVTRKLMLGWEVRVALQVTSTSNVGSSAAVSSAWTGTGAAPLDNLNTALDNVYDSTGLRPNRIVMGMPAWRSFRRHSSVRDIIFGTNNGGGYASLAQAADLLNVDQILVGGGFRNTGAEGQAETLATIWGDNVLAYYAPPNPSIDEPSFAYTLRWAPAGIPSMQAEIHPFDRKTKSEEVEVGYYQDERITAAEYSFLLTAVNSST